jgi:hypothetical protein
MNRTGCLSLIALGACATAERPLATDKVQDANTAIAIAQQACGVRGKTQTDGWTAELQGRGWHVSQGGSWHLTQRGIRSWCPARAIEVSAADGSTEDCRVCVGD